MSETSELQNSIAEGIQAVFRPAVLEADLRIAGIFEAQQSLARQIEEFDMKLSEYRQLASAGPNFVEYQQIMVKSRKQLQATVKSLNRIKTRLLEMSVQADEAEARTATRLARA
eukprot:TRINITY_DN3343_c0_g1_i1.p1 TRINITY_DN3343_c0_g1~~TRINITY_DN3343_c0_g1_i1.p1  ORF type:complete len:114 (-),score=22.16 TRINITY_DN3343_c0_g1_i1:33-374(-)